MSQLAERCAAHTEFDSGRRSSRLSARLSRVEASDVSPERHCFERCTTAVAVLAAVAGTVMVCWGYSGHSMFGRYEFVPVLIVGVLAFAASVLRWTVINGGGRIRTSSLGVTGGDRWWPVVVLLLFGAGNLFWSLAKTTTVGGSPQINRRTGRYELNDHGSVRAVSRATYERAVLDIHQLVLSFAIVFACVAAGLSWALISQDRRAARFADRHRPLSPEDTVSVQGFVISESAAERTAPCRALVIADRDGLHVAYRGLFNSAGRGAGNELLPLRLRKYDWSTCWNDVTKVEQTGGRSFAVMCGEHRWAHVTVQSKRAFDRIYPFVGRLAGANENRRS